MKALLKVSNWHEGGELSDITLGSTHGSAVECVTLMCTLGKVKTVASKGSCVQLTEE